MAKLPPVCADCTAARMKWLDSKPSQVLPAFGIAHGSGAPYDASLAGVRDRSRSRHEQWRTLVRDQMAGIAASCRANHHTALTDQPAPVIVQLDLLALVAS